MFRRVLFWLGGWESLAAVALVPAFVPPSFAQSLEVVPGEYIVEYREDAPSLGAARVGSGAGANLSAAPRSIGPRTVVVKNSSSAFGISAAARTPAPYSPSDPFCASLPKSQVKSCSPNFIVRTSKTPNDSRFSSLWGLSSSAGIDAPRAWDSAVGSRDIVVAVLDTGVDYTHPDLAPNMWRNPEEVPGNGRDDDGDGYIDDVYGINAITGSGNPRDDNGHGTHVSGTIGAVGDNGVGVAGINWETSILALKFLDSEGSGSLADAIEAINYVVALKERGVNIRVLNASWGGGGYSEPLVSAIERLRDAGIVFVAAAGNETNDNDASPSYPASYELDNIVSVAATTIDQNLAYFSNYGAWSVDIAAPGQDIVSTVVGGGYESYSGTSMATPHVTGALALLASHEPSLDAGALINRLYASGVDLPALSGAVSTGRVLNVGRLMNGEGEGGPAAPPNLDACVYDIAETSVGRDTSADSAPVVQRSDELGFVTIDLPFQFPFHREEVSTVTVSPNGVVYMGRVADTFDFNPLEAAPRRSIAALHADLIADGASLGVRVASAADKVTIRWVARVYGWAGDTVEVTLTLFSDGTVRDSISIKSPELEQILQAGATIGLAGALSRSTVTFSNGGKSIHDGLEVTFTPMCGKAAVARLTGLRFMGSRGDRRSNVVYAGGRFTVDLTANHGGASVPLGVLINGRACTTGQRTVKMTGASARFRGSVRILKDHPEIKRIGLFSGALIKERRVEPSSSARVRRGARSISTPRVCRAILHSLRRSS